MKDIKKIQEFFSRNESVNEAEFKNINKDEHNIKLAIKDVEKKFRLKANRDNPPQYAQLSLNKIMLSKVLGREELGKEHQGAWEKLKQEYNLRDAVSEGPGQKHYTKDGKEWTGATHKMPDGPLMTQDPHNKDSEELFHKSDLDEVADPSALELVGALSVILGGSLGIKFGMDLLTKIVDKALAAAKYNAAEMLKIVKDNTSSLKAAAQEGKRAFAKKLMSLVGITNTTPSDVPFTIKRNEGTCGYDTDAATGRKLKTPGGL